MMKFSLIVSTIGRPDELRSFLDSIVAQNYQALEVIVIDQSQDQVIEPLSREYASRLVLIYKTSEKGLSRGRNVGLAVATGEVVCFPDDDCVYGDGLLHRVNDYLENNKNVDVLVGRTVDETGQTSMGNFDIDAQQVNRKSIWKNHNSVTLFIRHYVLRRTGWFNELLGAGTYFGSSEETNLLINILKAQFYVWYDPSFCVIHRQEYLERNKNAFLRARNYGRGVGALLAGQGSYFGIFDYFKVLCGPLFRMLINFYRPFYVRYYYQAFIGRIEGFIKVRGLWL